MQISTFVRWRAGRAKQGASIGMVGFGRSFLLMRLPSAALQAPCWTAAGPVRSRSQVGLVGSC